jgi:urease accessory protein
MSAGTTSSGLRGTGAVTLVTLAVLAPREAGAHLVSTGLGPFYDGIGHFLLTPEDLLPVVALALLAGLAGAGPGRAVLYALPAAWLVGGLAGLQLGGAPVLPVLTALVLLGLGLLVAADRRLPAPMGVALASLLGLLHGYANGVAMATAGLGAAAVLGICTALLVVLALLAAQVVALRRWWERIAVRVAGSWIAASGMLMLGWTLKDGGL